MRRYWQNRGGGFRRRIGRRVSAMQEMQERMKGFEVELELRRKEEMRSSTDRAILRQAMCRTSGAPSYGARNPSAYALG